MDKEEIKITIDGMDKIGQVLYGMKKPSPESAAMFNKFLSDLPITEHEKIIACFSYALLTVEKMFEVLNEQ